MGLQLHDARLQLHLALGVGQGKHRALGVQVGDFHDVAHLHGLGRLGKIARGGFQPFGQAVDAVLQALFQGVDLVIRRRPARFLHFL